MEFVGIGDLHCDGVMQKYLPDLNKRIMAEVRKPLNYARNKGVRNVFFYGDIFHKPQSSNEGQKLLLRTLMEYQDLSIHIIAGNHDKEGTGGALAEYHSLVFFEELRQYDYPSHVQLYVHDPAVVDIDGERINFLPWPHTKVRNKALNVMHVEVVGCRSDNGAVNQSRGIEATVSAVVGHMHTAQTIGDVHFSGTLYQTNFGEKLDKFFHHGTWRSGRLRIKKIRNNPGFELHNVVINSIEDLDDVPTEPDKLCKVFIHRSVAVPVSFLAEHPNVVKHNSFNTDKELETLVREELRIDKVEIQLDTERHLKAWLKRKTSHSVDVRKRAYSLYRDMRGS